MPGSLFVKRLWMSVLPTSFIGGEGVNIGRRTFELGIQDCHTNTDVGERPEIIQTSFDRHAWLLTVMLCPHVLLRQIFPQHTSPLKSSPMTLSSPTKLYKLRNQSLHVKLVYDTLRYYQQNLELLVFVYLRIYQLFLIIYFSTCCILTLHCFDIELLLWLQHAVDTLIVMSFATYYLRCLTAAMLRMFHKVVYWRFSDEVENLRTLNA